MASSFVIAMGTLHAVGDVQSRHFASLDKREKERRKEVKETVTD